MNAAFYLEEKYREYSNGCVHAEGAEGRHLGGGPNPEGHEVCERGDGDGHARVLHRPPEPLRHTPRAEMLLAERVPTLDDDEHIVNTWRNMSSNMISDPVTNLFRA